MRISMNFTVSKELKSIGSKNVPIGGWIYGILRKSSPEYANWLHDQGIMVGKKRIKPFVYSRLYTTSRGFGLKISTSQPSFIFHFLQAAKETPLRIDDVELRIDKMNFFDPNLEKNQAGRFFTLSPILVKNKQGFIKDLNSTEYNQAVTENLRSKYEAIHGEKPESKENVFINFKDPKIVGISAKGHIFHGVVGEFTMGGSRELIDIAYTLGLGAKNGMGFGCIENAKFRGASTPDFSDLAKAI